MLPLSTSGSQVQMAGGWRVTVTSPQIAVSPDARASRASAETTSSGAAASSSTDMRTIEVISGLPALRISSKAMS
jgi:hypothetical protein